MIDVENLVKHYGNHKAVNGIGFKAEAGEIIGLLGPNGAGKTTTMRILTGYLPPTSGRVLVAGYDVLEDSFSVRGQVGYMPERVPIYPDMTVQGYVMFWANLRRVKKARTRVEDVLRQFDLYERRNKLVRSLSKGLRQRLGLAQAVVHEPPVIILDEPTIGIDPQQVIEVRNFIHALKSKHTVLVSSHILSEIEQICDRVIIMNRGVIVAEGTPDILRQKVRPMNRLYVEMDAPSDIGETLLKQVAGVAHIQAEGAGFLVSVEDDKVVRKQIAQRCAGENIDILEMRRLEASLEEVFLSLLEKSS